MTKSQKSQEFELLSLKVKVLSACLVKESKKDLENRLKKENMDLSSLGFAVMCYLHYQPATLVEISDNMLLAPATLVPVIDSLESQGFVKREHDPEDRRKNSISLTQKGKLLLSHIPGVSKEDLMVKAISSLGRKKALMLVSLLSELLDNMSEKQDRSKNIILKIENVQKEISRQK